MGGAITYRVDGTRGGAITYRVDGTRGGAITYRVDGTRGGALTYRVGAEGGVAGGYRIAFEGIAESGYEGDISIDDVSVTDGVCDQGGVEAVKVEFDTSELIDDDEDELARYRRRRLERLWNRLRKKQLAGK
ncbi:hypothetical protein ACOMHN_029531 [Nucella lapillus]